MNAVALQRQIALAHERLLPERGSASGLRERLTARLLRAVLRRAAASRGLEVEQGCLRLFTADREDLEEAAEPALAELWDEAPTPERIGDLYEAATLLEVVEPEADRLAIVPARARKQSGVFFTPRELTRSVVSAALAAVTTHAPRVCDPAVGGGAFLIEVCRQLAAGGRSKSSIAAGCLYGVDRSELAIWVAEACIWLEVGDPSWDARPLHSRLLSGDSLLGFDWERELPEIAGRGFDLVIGNPPWVAYAGRAAQPLAPETRAAYARSYQAFAGYPTLHGMFVERAAKLAARGVVALLLPSPVADLTGYAPVRRALALSHSVREPLLEFGQDAFAGVTQPCFALIAEPASSAEVEREWRLAERQRQAGSARELEPPEVLARIAAGPSLPRELFGEMGFQSAGDVSKTLFLRGEQPDADHSYPLLEGKDVAEFRQRQPRLFLRPDPEALRRARCRLRALGDYARVAFVVRQTAKMPIAALHSGLPFRNTLLAGFCHDELPAPLMVSLLNSALYRALHVARRRDARQAAFPQVKIAHLRALPRPSAHARLWPRLSEIAHLATAHGITPELRAELDHSVFELFDVSRVDREAVLEFLSQRGIGGGS